MSQRHLIIKTTCLLITAVLLSCVTAVQAQLKANFSADTTQGCAPLIVKFTDLTTGNPTFWFWDLGNGTTSTAQNPTTFYFDPGNYTVKLVVKTASGKDSVVKTNFIKVYASPNINFTATPTTGCFPLKVKFTDLTIAGSGTVTSWQWDFGDGNFSALQNPEHIYDVAGNFTITLKVVNSSGCFSILSKPSYIKILSGVKANFGYSSLLTCSPPTIIQFLDSSRGDNINSYVWSFGDGTTSTLKNPPHTYLVSGSYAVKLVIRNTVGCIDSITKPNAVVVGTVRANFTSPDSVCQATPLRFTNTSFPTPTSVTWYFGDGTTSKSLNPIKSYSSSGNFTVKMVANFGACKDSISKSVYVRPKPVANFGINGTTGACAPPVTVSFSNATPGAVSYFWDFGDSTTSTLPNPNHTYNILGNFSVKLVVTDSKGCTDTIIKKDAVYLGPPEITGIQGIPYRGCSPYSTTFSALINSPEPVAKYEWDFGDGITSGQVSPFHSYTVDGTYSVSLIITTINGCKDTLLAGGAIAVNSKPKANFSALPRESCAFKPIQFTDQSTGNVSSWEWSFGNNGFSSLQNPSYLYGDTGYFNITLIVKNNFCSDTIVRRNYVHISPPIARFIRYASCDTPLLRRFEDQSIGSNSWKWTFGDGNLSNQQNPVHNYAVPGVYFVDLEVSNGTCKHIFHDTLTVIDEKPDFIFTDTSLCKNSNTTFTATNIHPENITMYSWGFGDGNIKITITPQTTYAYSNSGNFFPTLVTTDINGCTDTVRHRLGIRIYGPKAKFTNPEGTCLNGTIPFTDLSTVDSIYPIKSWTWDFGDSTVQNFKGPPFQHQYTAQGSFNIKLSIVDSNGCRDTILKPNAVLITRPKALFAADSVKCSNNKIQFNNLSEGVDLKYEWTFGDGGVSTDANPLHAYKTEGTYTVKLGITDRFGCTDSLILTKGIFISNPKASFLSSDTVGLCPPFIVNLTNTSTNFSSLSWNFGDEGFSNVSNPSHFYNYPGSYTVKLVAYGFGNCADSVFKLVVVKGPTGSIEYDTASVCNPGKVNFTAITKNAASFIWDFSDGNTLQTRDSVVSHTYTRAGVYRPRIILINATGCRVPVTGLNDITVADVMANITSINRTYCDSAYLTFMDSSMAENDEIDNYSWSFGDGTTSTTANPNHQYTSPGNYMVSLMVNTRKGCKDTAFLSTPIKIVQSPAITIVGEAKGCENHVVLIKGNFERTDTSLVRWAWNFGNGNTAVIQNPPSQEYSIAGSYDVRAIATNSSGCVDTAFHTVKINPTPKVDAGPDSIICLGQRLVLQPSGAEAYTWAANPSLSCTNCANPTASPYDSLVLYTVIGTNSTGCANNDSVYIKVLQPFRIFTTTADTLCLGESVNLLAKGTDFYTWSPANGLSNPNLANPVAKPTSTTNYQVIGTDYRGCFKDTGYVPIAVYPIPTFNIVQDSITLAVGSSVKLNTSNSADINRWRWLPSQGLNCNNCPEPIASPRNSVTYLAEAYNQGGCRSTDRVTIYVICNNGNFYIPNTFSPNGDGMNDIFYPRGKGIAGIRSFTIFNRWGAVVFQRMNLAANDPTAGWDGTYNGAKLSPDVFVYSVDIICENNQIFPVKGNVTLIR